MTKRYSVYLLVILIIGCKPAEETTTWNLKCGIHEVHFVSDSDTTYATYYLPFDVYYHGGYKKWVNECIMEEFGAVKRPTDHYLITCFDSTYGEINKPGFSAKEIKDNLIRIKSDSVRIKVRDYFITKVDGNWLALSEIAFSQVKKFAIKNKLEKLSLEFNSFHALFANLSNEEAVSITAEWLAVIQHVYFDTEQWEKEEDHIINLLEVMGRPYKNSNLKEDKTGKQ